MSDLLATVLLVGHSLVSPTLPVYMEAVTAAAAGRAAQVDYQVINGAPLGFNWQQSHNAEGVDGRAALATGVYDVLVVTEGIPFHSVRAEWSGSVGDALNWHELATGANPQARTYMYETWHDLRSGTGADYGTDHFGHIPWRERLDVALDDWEYVVDQVNARRSPGSQPMRIVPAGQAMALLHDEIARGAVEGLDDIRGLFADDIHPNDTGWYFIAMVHFAALYDRAPVGLPAALVSPRRGPLPAVDPDLARELQWIAWRAVQTHAARRSEG